MTTRKMHTVIQNRDFFDKKIEQTNAYRCLYENCHFGGKDVKVNHIEIVDCAFINCTFNEMDLSYFRIDGCNFIDCYFSQVNLITQMPALMSEYKIKESSFICCHIRECDLHETSFIRNIVNNSLVFKTNFVDIEGTGSFFRNSILEECSLGESAVIEMDYRSCNFPSFSFSPKVAKRWRKWFVTQYIEPKGVQTTFWAIGYDNQSNHHVLVKLYRDCTDPRYMSENDIAAKVMDFYEEDGQTLANTKSVSYPEAHSIELLKGAIFNFRNQSIYETPEDAIRGYCVIYGLENYHTEYGFREVKGGVDN